MSLRDLADYYLNLRLITPVYAGLARRMDSEALHGLLAFLYTGSRCRDPRRIADRAGRFLVEPSHRSEYVELVRRQFPESPEATLARADLIREHVFDLLGSGPVSLGPEIDWSKDFKTGARWDAGFYQDLQLVRGDGSDIKLPWELSRFQFTPILGRAYWFSGNEGYAASFADLLTSWLDANPTGCGPAWGCAMEAAIRVCNWLAGYAFFRDSPRLTPELRERLFRGVRDHQMFIRMNLEFGYLCAKDDPPPANPILRKLRRTPANNNHYLADLTGMILPALVLSGACSPRLGRQGLRRLEREAPRQFRPDGICHELSPGYHRLDMEFFLAMLLLCQAQGRSAPPHLAACTAAGFDYIAACLRPDGTMPMLRDGDDGRLFSFTGLPPGDFRYLLDIGAALYGRADLRLPGSPSEEALWWLGPERFTKLLAMPSRPARTSQAFPDSGVYVLRDGHDVMTVLCAPTGIGGHGAHAHCDALHMELACAGRPVLVDPGSYVYSSDPAMRNALRATAAHNTLRVDGEEINPFDPGQLFFMAEAAHPQVHAWEPGPGAMRLVASHRGYTRLEGAVLHRREVAFDPETRRWTITDSLDGSGTHALELFFHLAPGLDVQIDPGTEAVRILESSGTTPLLTLRPDPGWELAVEEGHFSPSYGVLQPATVLRLARRATLPFAARTRLETPCPKQGTYSEPATDTASDTDPGDQTRPRGHTAPEALTRPLEP